MEELVAILVPLGCGMVLPLGIVWMIAKRKMAEDQSRKEIIMSALEKNPNVDVEELMLKLNAPKKLLKEKLLKKLLWGMLFFFAGIGLIVVAIVIGIYEKCLSDPLYFTGMWGVILLAIGMGLLANYKVGRKMLAEEMDAELKNLQKK